MRDQFAAIERPRARTVLIVAAALLLLGLFIAYRWSGSAPVQRYGLVQSAGPMSGGKVSGGTRQIALVQLSDGSVVPANVVFNGLVSAGDKVSLLEEHRLIGGSAYQIVAKDKGQ